MRGTIIEVVGDYFRLDTAPKSLWWDARVHLGFAPEVGSTVTASAAELGYSLPMGGPHLAETVRANYTRLLESAA